MNLPVASQCWRKRLANDSPFHSRHPVAGSNCGVPTRLWALHLMHFVASARLLGVYSVG